MGGNDHPEHVLSPAGAAERRDREVTDSDSVSMSARRSRRCRRRSQAARNTFVVLLSYGYARACRTPVATAPPHDAVDISIRTRA
jgi:hypothetical protein